MRHQYSAIKTGSHQDKTTYNLKISNLKLIIDNLPLLMGKYN